MTQSVDVEIYADIICPWCYIGKKRLDAAFAARPHVTPRYIWRCFMLNPTMPSTGMDRQAYLIGKFGNAAKAVYGRIADAGLESGIAFNFEGIKRTPDSRKTHRYLLAAAAKGHDLSDAFPKPISLMAAILAMMMNLPKSSMKTALPLIRPALPIQPLTGKLPMISKCRASFGSMAFRL